MADAKSCPVPEPTGHQAEPFVRKRHAADLPPPFADHYSTFSVVGGDISTF